MDNVRSLSEETTTPPNSAEEILTGPVYKMEETEPDEGDEIKIGLAEEVDDADEIKIGLAEQVDN